MPLSEKGASRRVKGDPKGAGWAKALSDVAVCECSCLSLSTAWAKCFLGFWWFFFFFLPFKNIKSSSDLAHTEDRFMISICISVGAKEAGVRVGDVSS